MTNQTSFEVVTSDSQVKQSYRDQMKPASTLNKAIKAFEKSKQGAMFKLFKIVEQLDVEQLQGQLGECKDLVKLIKLSKRNPACKQFIYENVRVHHKTGTSCVYWVCECIIKHQDTLRQLQQTSALKAMLNASQDANKAA